MNCVNCIAIIFMNIINTPVAHFNIFDLWTQLICIIINYYYKQNNFVYENMTKQKRKNHSNADRIKAPPLTLSKSMVHVLRSIWRLW